MGETHTTYPEPGLGAYPWMRYNGEPWCRFSSTMAGLEMEKEFEEEYGEQLFCSLNCWEMVNQVNRMKALFPDANVDLMIGPCPEG